MPVEIHVACRRDPSMVASIVGRGQLVHVELAPPASIRAWSPRAHATLLLRARDVAGIVTLRATAAAAIVAEYAELVARALEGVAIRDGEILDLAVHQPIDLAALGAVWAALDARHGAAFPTPRAGVARTQAAAGIGRTQAAAGAPGRTKIAVPAGAAARAGAPADAENRDHSTH